MNYTLGPSDVSIQGDIEAGLQYVPRAQHMLRRLLVRAEAGQIMTLSTHERLSPTAYMYGIIAGSIAKAVIVADAEPGIGGAPPRVIAQVPDFYSGAVLDGRIISGSPLATPPTRDKLTLFSPTSACANRFHLGDPQAVGKLAVEPYPPYADVLGPPENSAFRFSQYVKLKPTMYSGLMREVVQHLMGFGKQIGPSIYDRARPRIKVKKRATPTPYETTVAKDGLQIRYDWRWFRTHGIVRAADDRLWLIEVGTTRGVIATPLPLNAVSQMPEFREKLEQMNDGPGIAALDAFGGFPTGESFPSGDVDSWIRAGLVLRMASSDDLDPFYQHTPYASCFGWAFNEDGSEAHNTAWGYQAQWKYGYHYALFNDIGATIELPTPAPGASTLKQRLVGLAGQDSYRDRFRAVMFKIDRMEQRDIDTYLHNGGSPGSVFEEIDEITMDPIATATSRLQLQSSGYLFWRFRLQTHMKFPSPELGYLLSFDMHPQFGFNAPPERCDTTVFVFFRGMELKYVRYFYDPNAVVPDIDENDFEPCMYQGSWTSTFEGERAIPAMMYSNDFDHREERGASLSTTRIRGAGMGISAQSCADSLIFPPHASCTQRRRFSREVHTVNESGRSLASTISVPFYDRCAYYYAVAYAAGGHSESTTHGFVDLTSPWSCNTWRNFPGWTGNFVGDIDNGHWVSFSLHPDGCGPVVARTGRTPSPVYSGTVPCADDADGGPWCFVCDNLDEMTFDIPPPTPPPTVIINTPNQSNCKAYLVYDGDFSPLMTQNVNNTNVYWFIPSPDPDSGVTQFIESTANGFGEGNIVQYQTEPFGPRQHRGGPEFTALDQHSATFVGVLP